MIHKDKLLENKTMGWSTVRSCTVGCVKIGNIAILGDKIPHTQRLNTLFLRVPPACLGSTAHGSRADTPLQLNSKKMV